MITIANHSKIKIATSTQRYVQQEIKFFSSAQSNVITTDKSEKEIIINKFNYDKIRIEVMDYWMKAEASSTRGLTTKARYCCFTYHDAQQEYLKSTAHWHWLDQELSSNYAGETGAVYIYKGAISALTLRPHSKAMEFCKMHMATEQSHLDMFEKIIPNGKRTKLIPFWKIAGFSLGFLPTMIGGSEALYVTVEAVETFVEEHFQHQIIPLRKQESCPELVKLLTHCCADEVHHKEDAKTHLLDGNNVLDSWWIGPWSWVVKTGSSVAAELARRF